MNTYDPQPPQNQRPIGVPLLVSLSTYSTRCSSPVMVTLEASIARFVPKIPPATRRQLRQWQRWPRRVEGPKSGMSESWMVTVMRAQRQCPDMLLLLVVIGGWVVMVFGGPEGLLSERGGIEEKSERVFERELQVGLMGQCFHRCINELNMSILRSRSMSLSCLVAKSGSYARANSAATGMPF
jgi:hypothetical protein